MTVADLCDASLTVSHNTATNLPLGLLGGPTVVTAFAPGLDDATTRFHRNEPQLNVSTGPDDERDPPHTGRHRREHASGAPRWRPAAGRPRVAHHLARREHHRRRHHPGRRASRVADRGQDRDRSTGRAQRRRDRAAPGPRAAGLAVYPDPADPESMVGNATIAEATTIAVRRLVGQ
nr:serine hydrolase [Streptomyces tendae]